MLQERGRPIFDRRSHAWVTASITKSPLIRVFRVKISIYFKLSLKYWIHNSFLPFPIFFCFRYNKMLTTPGMICKQFKGSFHIKPRPFPVIVSLFVTSNSSNNKLFFLYISFNENEVFVVIF